MSWRMLPVFGAYAIILAGCISTGTHEATLAELEQSRQIAARTAAEFEAFKEQATAQMKASEAEQARLGKELMGSLQRVEQAEADFESTQYHLANARTSQQDTETTLANLREQHGELDRERGELRQDRDALQTNIEDLQRRFETALQELSSGKRALADAHGRIGALEQESQEREAALSQAQEQRRMLEASLAAEQVKVARLHEDKQRLLSGTTTAREEIARLQKRAGQLETVAARVHELDQQIRERDQEIGTLRQAAADRETLATRLATLSGELGGLQEDAIRSRQERDQLTAQAMTLTGDLERSRERAHALSDELDSLRAGLDNLEAERARLEQERAAKETDIRVLTDSRAELSRSLDEQQAERARLERQRIAKEAEIRRLGQMHAELSKSLEAEIAKGDIRIRQVRDRLRINMVDQVLFDSARAVVKPEGLEVLKRVSAILTKVDDKQIRIEGHTDNVPIGPKIIHRFPTNWELSTARATSVVRYLIDEGGVEKANLSAVGYAHNRPVASNETPEGRAENRRIEIVLYPKDLSEIASF